MPKRTEIKEETENIKGLQSELARYPKNKHLKNLLRKAKMNKRKLRAQLASGGVIKAAHKLAGKAARSQSTNWKIGLLRPPTVPMQANQLRQGHRTWDFAPAR